MAVTSPGALTRLGPPCESRSPEHWHGPKRDVNIGYLDAQSVWYAGRRRLHRALSLNLPDCYPTRRCSARRSERIGGRGS